MAEMPRVDRGPLRRILTLLGAATLVLALVAPSAASADGNKDDDGQKSEKVAPEKEPSVEDEGQAIPPFVTLLGKHGNWTKFEGPLGRVYGNGETSDGFVAISGADLSDVCTNTPPLVAQGRFRQKSDGTWVVRTERGGNSRSVAVYDTGLDVFAFFDASCPLFGTDDFPEPFATGTVVQLDKAWEQPEPFPQLQRGRYRNSIRGWVSDVDGNKYRIRAVAEYEVGETGNLTFSRDFLKVRPRR
jgi:hypothetical protein